MQELLQFVIMSQLTLIIFTIIIMPSLSYLKLFTRQKQTNDFLS